MTLIQQFMPRWRLRQVDHVAVLSPPRDAYEAVRNLDFYRLPVARFLFGMRRLPQRIAAWVRRRPEPMAPTSRIEQFTAPGTGFHLLASGTHELVVGSIGRFWKPTIEFADTSPASFAGHDDRGWGKLAWSLSVHPRVGGGSWITFDLRVDAGDDASWRKFRTYWRLIGPFSHALRRALLRELARQLGAASDDNRDLPGDDLLDEVHTQLTHATDIEAPPERVWPWLVQMGARRAGWYSYDRLDNGGVPSADHIIPELQHLSVGDVLPASPRSPDGFEVLQIEPGRALVLGGAAASFDSTWTFAIEPIGNDATHLITRYSAAYTPRPRMSLMASVMSPLHAFMTHKQLATLRQRAESDA